MTECCSTQRTVSQVFDRVCQVDFRAAQSTPQCGAAASLGEIRDDTSSTDSRRQVRHVLQGHIFTSLQTLFHVSFPPSTHLLQLTTHQSTSKPTHTTPQSQSKCLELPTSVTPLSTRPLIRERTRTLRSPRPSRRPVSTRARSTLTRPTTPVRSITLMTVNHIH